MGDFKGLLEQLPVCTWLLGCFTTPFLQHRLCIFEC